MQRKLFFDLTRLTILSQHFHGSCPENTKEIQILHLSTVADNKLSSTTVSGDIPPGFKPTATYNDTNSYISPDLQKENIMDNDFSRDSQFKHENYILKHGVASVLVEKVFLMHHVGCLWLNTNWVGRCSVSGLDLTISLSEIQVKDGPILFS